MIIFEGKTDRCIKGLKGTPGMMIAYQRKAWMNGELMMGWDHAIQRSLKNIVNKLF